jgi:hypothetical protein
LKISKHGLDQASYEVALEKYRVESLKRVKRKNAESKTSHKLRVALFDKATVTIWDPSEELVGSFECEKGEMEKTIEIQNGRYRVCVSNPRDVEIYVDGSNRSPDSKKSTWLEFVLEVGNNDYN